MEKNLYDCIVVFTLKPIQNNLDYCGKTHASKCNIAVMRNRKAELDKFISKCLCFAPL